MERLGLIPEDVVLPLEKGFILCDEKGVGKVTLLSIIGKGGTAIAYKGIRKRKGHTVTCIVKEYFPEQKAEQGKYIRKHVGEKLTIPEAYREAELELQKENVRREIQTNQDIYFREEDIKAPGFNNSSYVYSAEYLCSLGDSSYIVLDSSEGETLCARGNRGKLTPDEALRFIYQLLIIVEHLHEKGFVHGDIKPENLWIRGEAENQSMCLLDFGSAFRLADYQVDISQMEDEEIMEAADRIIRNESMGSNTRGYCSVNIRRLESDKNIYDTTDHSLDRGKKLLAAVNEIGVSDDLFSAVKVAGKLLEETDMTEDERESVQEIWREINRKNSDPGFQSVEELRKEIEILDTVLHKGAHPAVLERGVRQMAENLELDGFDWDLLCDVK